MLVLHCRSGFSFLGNFVTVHFALLVIPISRLPVVLEGLVDRSILIGGVLLRLGWLVQPSLKHGDGGVTTCLVEGEHVAFTTTSMGVIG